MAKTEKDTGVRMGDEVNRKVGEAREKRLAAATEASSNGAFGKVVKGGKARLIPINEVYAKEDEDRGEGFEVEDRTVEGRGKFLPDSPTDAAQRKLGSPKGQASPSETPTEDEEEAPEADEAFDPTDPEAVSLGDLEEALSGLDQEQVLVAQDNDSRKGAKEVYEKLLASE